jgi:hypothetical protein
MIVDTLVDQLGSWLRDVRAERLAAKDKEAAARDDRAAQVLHDASVLLASMLAYDNAARSAYRSAYLFASQDRVADEDAAVKEDRRKAYRNLQSFEDLEDLYRRAGRALSQLRAECGQLAGVTWQGPLSELISCGNEFRSITQDVRDSKQKYTQEFQQGYRSSEFMRALASGSPSADVAKYATRMMSRINPLTELLDRADVAYSDLCATVRRSHNLPPLPALNP